MTKIRDARPEDAERLLEIYAWYVLNTAISFEWTVPTVEEFRARIEKTLRAYPYLVAVREGEILGYAYAGPFVGREAYAWSAELTIYLDHGARRGGIGRQLYEALEERLRQKGIRNLYACIGVPEEEDAYLTRNSADFHAHLGFSLAGKFTNCGYKFGRWYHMVWMEKIIGEHADPGEPAQVLCIGQAVIDCITRGQEPDRHRENVFRAERIELHIGGDAVNESVALTELGRRAAIACGTGTDLAGNLLRAELTRRGVDTAHVTVLDTLTTPIAQLVVHQDGGRHSINSRATMLEGYVPFIPAAAPEDPAAVRAALAAAGGLREARAGGLREARPGGCGAGEAGSMAGGRAASAMRSAMRGVRIVSLASLFRAPLDRAEVIRALVLAAKEAGALVSADTKLPTFREVPAEALADVWPLIDFLFPNENEAAYYTGETELPGMAAVFRRWGVRNVVIKAGAEGCYVDGEGYTLRPEGGCAEVPAEGQGHAVKPGKGCAQGPAEGHAVKPGNGCAGGPADGRAEGAGEGSVRGSGPAAFHLPALPVRVVDSTGAGDNFVAGFLSGVLDGAGLRACAERGRERASQCISRMGAGEPS